MEKASYQPYSTISGNYSLFSASHYFSHRFGVQPSVYRPVRLLYKDTCLEKLEKNFKCIFEATVPFKTKAKDELKTVTTIYAFEGEDIVIYLERSRMETFLDEHIDVEFDHSTQRDINSPTFSLTILYSDRKKLADAITYFEVQEESPTNNIYLIVGSPTEGFVLKEFNTKLPCKDMNLDINYGETFAKKHKTILKRLNAANDTGLVILNGKPGTGKTTYIKYLTTILSKKIIFVPPNMAEGITAPSFLPFLLENKNSILVIEDAEKVIGSRDSNDTNNGVSNILNMTDGVLGDCLNIQIIATLNTTRERIDPALLRRGRLIAEHEFKELSIEDSNKLFKHLKTKKTTDKPLTLTDIYNNEEESIEADKPEVKRMGF